MNKFVRSVSLVLIVAIAGCAGPQTSNSTNSASNGDPCNAVAAAIGGALVGALLAGKHDRAGGALAGGVVASAACLAVNYNSRQVKSAQQVSQEYMQQRGALPERAALVRYDTRFDPSATIKGGGTSNVVSYIEVIPGRDRVQPLVEEEITLYGPDGKLLKTVRKTPSSTASAGAFQSQFALAMPEGVPQGVYPLHSAIYVNGKVARTSDLRLQIVESERLSVVAAAR